MAKEVKGGFQRATGAIGSDVKGQAAIPFTVSPEHPFNVTVLDSVYVEKLESKEDETVLIPVLHFLFKDVEGIQSHVHKEWPIDGDLVTKKGNTISQADLENTQSDRISHIFNTFAGSGAHTRLNNGAGLGADGVAKGGADIYEFYENFFNSIANSFNTAGPDGSPVFKKNGKGIKVWTKLIYSDTQLVFPLRPNFLDLWFPNRPTFLRVTPDQVTMKSRKRSGGTMPGISTSDDTSDLPAGFN